MISNFNLLILAVSTVSLFLYGLRSFTDEVKNNNTLRFRERLSKFSTNRIFGFFTGAVLTATIQSSSAVSGMAVALVDSGAITLQQAFGVLLGTKLGTTATAWIVSMGFSNIGPYFILFGTFLSAMPIKAHLYGKAFFYFGFILFSISLLSDYISVMDRTDWELGPHGLVNQFGTALLIGVLATIVLQSSSFVNGILVVLAMHQLVSLHIACGIVMGTSLGATSTALYQSIRYSSNAKRTAYAHLVFNFVGFLLFLPALTFIETSVEGMHSQLPIQVAIFQLIYYLFIGLIFLPFLNHISVWIEKKYPTASQGETPNELS